MPRDAGTLLKVAFLVLSLGLDTFAVAVALGMAGIGRRNRLRAGASFALFEGGMPLVGFIAGRLVSGALGEVASVGGIVILFGVGTWMVYESLGGNEARDFSVGSWRGLILTSVSVSMDELAIGFSMGALGLPLGITVALIAAQAFGLTLVGTALGNRVGAELTERAGTVAGLILCGLALLLAVEHLTGA